MFLKIIIKLFILINIIITTHLSYAQEDVGKYILEDSIDEVYGIINQRYITNVNQNGITESAINGIMHGLDEHSIYFNPKQYKEFRNSTDGEFGGVGIEMAKINDIIAVMTVMKDTPADKAGIISEDVITEINDETILNLSMYQIGQKVRGAVGSKVKIKIYRKSIDQILEFILTRESIKIGTVKYDIIDKNDNIGYIEVFMFNHQTADDFIFAINFLLAQNIKYLIIDLRDNPGGLLDAAVKISNIFLQKNQLITTVKARDDTLLSEYRAKENNNIFTNIPIAILINKGSASASEIVAAALQENDIAKLIGEKSFGKASVQELIELTAIPGAAIKITVAKYFTPKGKMIHGVGIVPDFEIIDIKQKINVKKYKKNYNKNEQDYNQDNVLQSAKTILKENTN